eukprot:Gb_22890 [translate_table: standard]
MGGSPAVCHVSKLCRVPTVPCGGGCWPITLAARDRRLLRFQPRSTSMSFKSNCNLASRSHGGIPAEIFQDNIYYPNIYRADVTPKPANVFPAIRQQAKYGMGRPSCTAIGMDIGEFFKIHIKKVIGSIKIGFTYEVKVQYTVRDLRLISPAPFHMSRYRSSYRSNFPFQKRFSGSPSQYVFRMRHQTAILFSETANVIKRTVELFVHFPAGLLFFHYLSILEPLLFHFLSLSHHPNAFEVTEAGEQEGQVGAIRAQARAGGGVQRTIEQARTIATHKSIAVTKSSTGDSEKKSMVGALKRLNAEIEDKSSTTKSSGCDMTGKYFATKDCSDEMTEKPKICYAGEVVEEEKPAKECSMCGDVGFADDLVLCQRCGYRYCSKQYPDLDMETWACEWCLYEEETAKQDKVKLGKRKTLNITESRSKAFEFLLQIAQSLPNSSEQEITDKRQKENGDITDKRPKDNGDVTHRGQIEIGDIADRRLNSIAPKKVNGLKNVKENGFKVGLVRSKEENALKVGHLSERLNGNYKEENSAKCELVPKKQRCNQATDKHKALDRWRNLSKSKLHCNTSKAIGRRYKLLADVLC